MAWKWSQPAAPGSSGGNAGFPVYIGALLSQREQSLPGVCGHGLQGAPALQ